MKRANKTGLPWKIIIAIVGGGVTLTLAGYFLYLYFVKETSKQSIANSGPPPAVVTAATATKQIWRSQLTTVGTLQAIQGIDVTTEIAGKVVEITFNAGAYVEPGDLLVKLNTSTERAELRALEARLNKARSDEARARQLVDHGFISEAGLEQSTTDAENLQAQVEQQSTRIRKKTIRAPFAGKLGIRQISPGELISPGTPIVMLQSISPIFVNFTLPEQAFSKVKPGQNVVISVAAYPKQVFKGKISAINPRISEKTRNFTVQALLPNHKQHLQPGMFADVTIDLGSKRQVIAVPASAITFNAYGKSIFFVRKSAQELDKSGNDASEARSLASQVKSDKPVDAQKSKQLSTQGRGPVMVAERAFIETGEQRGLMIEIIKGVEAGERIVTAGQIKLDDGFPIIISDEDVLQNADPRPTEP